ncbi:MAG: CPBP family intramembrane glutamic endopeptidase [Bacteroidales bacterium]|nr:CPBP family intramembrane glutamic endopeptidase [Bacteroidales bacterium]
MKEKLKSYLIIIAYLIIGIIVMGTTHLLKIPDWLNSAYILLSLFIIVNILTANVFQLNNEIRIFWSIRKIYFLLIGVSVGVIIAVSPILIGLIIGKATINELILNTAFNVKSIILTLSIVTWEELWFRGIFLNHCNKKLSATNISITIGLLFMLAHLLNPEINIIKTGPILFFAGAFLTIIYFYFKTIWLPIGVHFGNNFLIIESKLDNHWFFGNEGYLGAIILAGFFLLFVKLTLKKRYPTRLSHNSKLSQI